MRIERSHTADRSSAQLIVPLPDALDETRVGAKARNLARLCRLGIAVPDGFVVTDAALQMFLDAAELHLPITALTERLEMKSPIGIGCAADTIAALVREEPLPPSLTSRLAGAFADLGASPVIVRSSALGEDSAGASFAGQLDSITGIVAPAPLERAILDVWASRWSARALAYEIAVGVRLAGMGVIVQRQIDARLSGVLFTRSPGHQSHMLIEYCAGLGEALVAGRENPGRVTVARRGFRWITQADPERPAPDAALLLNDITIASLARIALAIEDEFGSPQDVEWTIDESGALWIVQARPITTAAAAARPPFDTVRWSNANVNENFPLPISPLLYSVARAGYYHYFRNLGRAFGISRRRLDAMEQPLGHIIGVHGARMYYNLTNIHAILRSAPFGEALARAFNRFVGVDELTPRSGGRPRPSQVRQAAELAVIAVRTTWQYLWLTRRVERFERTADEFAARTHPSRLADRGTRELASDLRGFLDIRCHHWNDAALADAAAMVCYGLLEALLRSALPAADQQALHNTLLKALPGLVSSMPPIALWRLSRLIRADADLLRLVTEATPNEALEAIRRDDRYAAFRAGLDAYLEQWGFRCSAELMLTVPSFQENPAPVIDLLKAYATIDGESPLDLVDRQRKERLEETGRVRAKLRRKRLLRGLPLLTGWFPVSIVLRWTQRSIQLRERARLKQALLYSRLRRIALALGDRLTADGRLDATDGIFFLTTDEIDTLVSGAEMFPDRVRDVITLRRQAHAELSTMAPPDSIQLAPGEYLSPGGFGIRDSGSGIRDSGLGIRDSGLGIGDCLEGTSACGGATTGRATILADVSESHRLTRGDVLVTRQTDPGWGPIFPLISGLVMERGGMLSHGAIIAREFGIPSVVGVRDATRRIPEGGTVSIDGDRGLVRVVEEAL